MLKRVPGLLAEAPVYPRWPNIMISSALLTLQSVLVWIINYTSTLHAHYVIIKFSLLCWLTELSKFRERAPQSRPGVSCFYCPRTINEKRTVACHRWRGFAPNSRGLCCDCPHSDLHKHPPSASWTLNSTIYTSHESEGRINYTTAWLCCRGFPWSGAPSPAVWWVLGERLRAHAQVQGAFLQYPNRPTRRVALY